MTDTKLFGKKLFGFSVVSGLVMIVLGLLFCFKPFIMSSIFNDVISIALIAGGIAAIAASYKSYTTNMLSGVIAVIAGIIFLLAPFATIQIISFFICVIIIINAVTGISRAGFMINNRISGGIPAMILYVILLISGIMLIFNPLGSLVATNMIMGLTLMISGIVWISVGNMMRKLDIEVERFSMNESDFM